MFGDDAGEELLAFTAHMRELDPDREEVAVELEALDSIYGDSSVRVWPSSKRNADDEGTATPTGQRKASPLEWRLGERIRFEVSTTLASPYETIKVRILVTLPQAYPASAPPQLQLLSRYIGDFSVDASIFGAILRTYIGHPGVEWNAGDAAVFDGIDFVQRTLGSWYGDHVSAQGEQRLQHEQAKAQMPELEPIHTTETETHEALAEGPGASLPEGISLVESEPITDRKSVFVGRACAITDPAQVPDIIAYLMSDRKISRAAHPVIYAWRFEINGTVHQDNDDNGETAAGGRLAHLLQIMGLTHVLVVVTRYFGGIHLGPDRFKHINAAARSAIELAGLLDDHTKKPKGGKRKLNL